MPSGWRSIVMHRSSARNVPTSRIYWIAFVWATTGVSTAQLRGRIARHGFGFAAPEALTRTAVWRSAVRSLVTTMMIVAMVAPAYAQLTPGNGPVGGSPGNGAAGGGRPGITLGGDKKAKTDDEVKYERELDQAYKSGLSKIPNQKAKVDPWGNVRGAATPQSNPNQQRPSSK